MSKKIMLVCGAGMSTSLLASKLNQEAKAQKLDYEIWAEPIASSKQNAINADMFLLGPQIRFELKNLQAVAGRKPVVVIEPIIYGRLDVKSLIAIIKDTLK